MFPTGKNMFEHSIKVPRLYKNAAKILKEVRENGSSPKDLIYQCKHRNIKAVYALVAETVKHFSDIEAVLKNSQLLEKESRLDPWLARILVTEMLWREKQLPGECKPIKTILSYYDALKEQKDNLGSAGNAQGEQKVRKPRFARINTLTIGLEEAVNAFQNEGWVLVPTPQNSYEDFVARGASLQPENFMIDLHVKELLLFSPNTQFYNHEAYKKGFIMLQDKASCLAAHLLNPPPGSTVLDMCAAPGMKTTHLAALLKNEGTVYAIEKNEKRFNILKKIVEDAGATCVKPIHKSAVDILPEECPNVEYILVDPSCSGSGMTQRITLDNKQEQSDPQRLQKLSSFQVVILNHALTKFPQAKMVVYSTCSIYQEENEDVVRRVMKYNNDFKLISARNLLNQNLEGFCPHEGDTITDLCLSMQPQKDFTDGFFVAVFKRIAEKKRKRQHDDGEVLLEISDDENPTVEPNKSNNENNDLSKIVENENESQEQEYVGKKAKIKKPQEEPSPAVDNVYERRRKKKLLKI